MHGFINLKLTRPRPLHTTLRFASAYRSLHWKQSASACLDMGNSQRKGVSVPRGEFDSVNRVDVGRCSACSSNFNPYSFSTWSQKIMWQLAMHWIHWFAIPKSGHQCQSRPWAQSKLRGLSPNFIEPTHNAVFNLSDFQQVYEWRLSKYMWPSYKTVISNTYNMYINIYI